jgi:hypothetical protein
MKSESTNSILINFMIFLIVFQLVYFLKYVIYEF